MAKFRQYQNGIFGHRYKKHYILRNNANKFKKGKLYTVIDEKRNVLMQDNPDYDECEWFIDKLVAMPEEMELYRKLYDCEIAQLHRMAAKYSQKSEDGTITKDEKSLYGLVRKIMDRKVKELDF